MPFVQRFIEPKFLSRAQLFDNDGNPKIGDFELETVINNTLCNALRQLASLVLAANEIFEDLGGQLEDVKKRSEVLKIKIGDVGRKVERFDPKEVTVPESDIGTFALLKTHFVSKHPTNSNLFTTENRPLALRNLYETATKTPVNLMRQLDRWRRDGSRSSRFFLCTPVLGAKRRRIKTKVDIDIETSVPAAIEELRRWTSNEALGDITVTPDCASRITSTFIDGNTTDGTIASDDEGIDHKLPSPEEQLQVVALKFPAQIVAVDITGKSFDRMSSHRRSLMQKSESPIRATDVAEDNTVRRKPRNRRTRSRRRNTLAGTDQKEIRDALTAGEVPSTPNESTTTITAVTRSKSSDLLKSTDIKNKKSHFNTIKQWGKSKYDKIMNKSTESKLELDKTSISSSEKSSINISLPQVKLRDSTTLKRLVNREEPHSSSGNWSASSESGRASITSEITNNPQSSSINSKRRYINTTGSITSEGTLTPDIINDLDGETSSIYSCDTEGYYTSFHLDSGLKTLKEEDLSPTPPTPLHSISVLSAESEYELFGKGSTSTTTSSAGTVCTTLLAPIVPERKSSLSNDTGTIKRSPKNGDVSPDSGHNTSSSPIESISSPNGVRSNSDFEFSESSDMEGPERIERIRVKTTINSSRIPSMCVITPQHSDDESDAKSLKINDYISLNELQVQVTDFLERKGARVVLDAEGKVIYSTDSLKKHTTFEPGKNVKSSNNQLIHRSTKIIRPVTNKQHQMVANIPTTEFNRPTTQIIIKASTGTTEIIRKLPLVTATTSPKPTKGAYVNVQEQDQVPNPTKHQHPPNIPTSPTMYRYGDQLLDIDTNRYISNQYYQQNRPSMYSTLPTKKTQFFTQETNTERSVTPDITRGLEKNKQPDINVPFNNSIRISPIDPRNLTGFKSSTPSKAVINLDNKLLSPKKSTMSNEELYAVIHKNKKKMNIEPEVPLIVQEVPKKLLKSPETGYLGDKSKSRLSWSPSKGEYIDFNTDISPPSKPKKQTSTLDFKRLLLQKSSTNSPKKLSAVEQLKITKQQIKPKMDIIDLSASPRNLNRKFFNNPPGSPNREQKPITKILSPKSQWRFNSPRSDVLSSPILEDYREDDSGEKKSSPKGMPRLNLESKPYTSATERLYAQRAQYFNPVKSPDKNPNQSVPPALETAF